MRKLSSMFKGFVLVGLLILTGIISTNAQTVSTFASGFGKIGDIAFDSSGNLYVSGTSQNKIFKVTQAGVVSTFAGSGTSGKLDGPAATAQFASPMHLAVDSSGNVFVTEDGNFSIRKITPAGVVSTFKAFTASGVAATGILVDEFGNIFYLHNREVHKVLPGGDDSVWAGSSKCSCQINGFQRDACFAKPVGLARDKINWVYTLESTGLRQEVRRIDGTGRVTYVGPQGQFTSADLAIDDKGNYFIATGSVQNNIKKMSPATGYAITNYAGTGQNGATDGPASTATFSNPVGLAFYNGVLYVADSGNGSVRKIQP